MTAYYNEHDPFAAAWLRELIDDGYIAAGHVDERDVRDVRPSDLDGFDQCHFFAGIGGWALALQLAGWPDDRSVWTGSCPCQPFSAAGRGGGFADERHLWPAFFHLIAKCRPAIVFGEQVASKPGLAWLDLVRSDLEGAGYAVGAADLCAAGCSAPHIRQRLWWVGALADGERVGHERLQREGCDRLDKWDVQQQAQSGSQSRNRSVFVADADNTRPQGRLVGRDGADQWTFRASGVVSRLDDGERDGWRTVGHDHGGHVGLVVNTASEAGAVGDADKQRHDRRGTCSTGRDESADTSSPWSDLKWLPCRDGKARPTQPGLQPLAHGVPNRVGTLRGAGNAIVPQVAAEFVRSYLDAVEPVV